MGGIRVAMIRRMPLIAAPLLVALGGCLMPPPIEEVSPPDNQPPRILKASLSPPTGKADVLDQSCAPYSYKADVADPDIDDKLYWRVFLDYYRDNKPGEAKSGAVTPRGESAPIGFTVDPNDSRFKNLLSEPHFVELLVSDRPFFDDDRFPLGRAVPDDAVTDVVVWTVVLEQSSSPEQVSCDRQ